MDNKISRRIYSISKGGFELMTIVAVNRRPSYTPFPEIRLITELGNFAVNCSWINPADWHTFWVNPLVGRTATSSEIFIELHCDVMQKE